MGLLAFWLLLAQSACFLQQSQCYNPPYFSPGPSPGPVTLSLPADKPPVLKSQSPIIFPSAMPPDLMSKQPFPMNPPLVEDLPPRADMPRPMSTEPLPVLRAKDPKVRHAWVCETVAGLVLQVTQVTNAAPWLH